MAGFCPMTMGRTPANPEPCVGQDCMAWRGGQVIPKGRVLVAGPQTDHIVSIDAAKQFGWEPIEPRPGHCGLAGEPTP